MADFKIQIDRAASAADEMHTLENALRSYPDQVARSITALQKNRTASFQPIYGRLRGVSSGVLGEAAKMDSLEQALRHIISFYTDAERQNLNDLNAPALRGTGRGNLEDIDKALQEFFQRLLDWLKKILNWNEKPEEEPQVITRQQEKEHDLYMQNEIFSLLNTPAYSKETWSKATVEQRKEILTKYLADLAGIYGVTVASKINFYSGESTSRGYYQHSGRQVSINVNYLSRTDSYQIMQTVIHEMRHAYQHSAVDDPDSYSVSPETIKQWKNNFSNYKSTGDGKTTYSEYVSQPVEYDAKNFAKQYTDLSGAKPSYTGSW